MIKQIRNLTSALILIAFAMTTFAQQAEFTETELTAHTKGIKDNIESKSSISNPMVIGPDLYNQMGEMSIYHTLNALFTETEMEKYSTYAADDFIVPQGENWDIKYVRNTLYNEYSIDSIVYYNVYIYADDNNKPGSTIVYNDLENTNFTLQPIKPYYYETTITLKTLASLPAGKYWICIQPANSTVNTTAGNASFNTAAVLENSLEGINSQAHFRNPNGGITTDTDWMSQSDYYNTMINTDIGYYNHHFAIYGVEKDNDLAVVGLKNPVSGDLLTANEVVTAVIQNHGKNKVLATDYTVKYRINGGAWIGQSDNGVDIESGAEIEIDFRDEADLSVQDIYTFEILIDYTNDDYLDNNTLTTSIENYGQLWKAKIDQHATYTTCDGTFTGHNGLGALDNNSNDTVTFLPGTTGNKIRLEFANTGMSGSYGFQFFNGSNTNAPKLAYVQTQEMHGLVIEALNNEGAITVIIPSVDVVHNTTFNFRGKISCVPIVNTNFKVESIATSKAYSWENETIELTAGLINQGLTTGKPLVTFFINETELNEMVSTTTMAFSEKGTSKTFWTPPAAGTYTITAKVPADEGSFPEEKEFSIEHEILTLGTFVEGFEEDVFPPEGWSNRIPGGSLHTNVSYNFRINWEGYKKVLFEGDTLITPKLDMQIDDTLEFLYKGSFEGSSLCKIYYASEPDGDWSYLHTVNHHLPFIVNYQVPLKRAAGANHLAFIVTSPTGDVELDFIRGTKLYFDEFDLTAVNLTGEATAIINEETIYNFKVRNMGSGTLTATDYSVKLWKEIDGISTEIASLPGVDITQGNYHTFNFNTIFTEFVKSKVYATIEYASDVNTKNNTSNKLPANITKPGSEEIYAGDPFSTKDNVKIIAGTFGSYSESIYFKEELNFKGEIAGITIYVKNTDATEFGLNLYLGETDKTNVAEGYFSTSALNQVFSGICEIEIDNKFKPYYIHFDKPFLYSGEKNLVVAFHRYLLNDNRVAYLRLQSTIVGSNRFRGKAFQEYEKYTDVSNPQILNSLFSEYENDIANINFLVKTTEMDASLIGKVSDENANNLEGTIMSIDGYANTTRTNVDGNYSFPVMPYGDININAIKHGYYDQTKQGTFTAANQTVVNFTMEGLKPVTVSGTVIANDSLNPVAGVDVYMTGYEMEFFATTDANGKYTFADVWGDQNYKVSFTHQKYASQTISINVPFENYTVNDVTLDELETPALNVIAQINEQGSVDLTWQAPYTGIESIVDPTQGSDFGEIWWNEPNEDVQLGNLFKVNKPGTVTNIEISTFYWEGAVSAELQLRFYNKDQVEIGVPVPFTLPDTTTVWMNIPVPNFSYTEDFYVMIHWPKVPYSTHAIRGTLLDENVSWLVDGNNNWIPLTEVTSEEKSGALAIRAQVLEAGNKGTKALISYDLWRTNTNDISNSDRWEVINSEPIQGNDIEINYTDESFVDATTGHYLYAVKANYTNASSDYTYSNSINKGLYCNTTVVVTANNNKDITGAKVTLRNKNGVYINNYTDLLTYGKVEFPRILKGDYELLITKGAEYESFKKAISINNDTTINAEIIEVIFTPSMLTVENNYTNKYALLSWGIGDEKTYQLDDGSAEKTIGIGVDADLQIGNLFDVQESGQIISIDLLAVLNDGVNQQGKVSLVFYNKNQIKIGSTPEFVLEATEDYKMINIPANFLPFQEAFYVMISFSSLEDKETNLIPMDTDENPGNAYYYDDQYGFITMAETGKWGNFIIRANVLVNGKKSGITAANPAIPATNKLTVDATNIKATEISQIKVAPINRSVLSFNIFLDDMTTPIAEGVTSYNFMFTEDDHLTKDGLNTYKAAVQAVFETNNSTLAYIDFEYDKEVSVLDALNEKVKMYPNPASSVLTITNCNNSTAEIYNITGEMVKTIKVNSNSQNVNVSTLSNGSYIVKLVTLNGNIYRKIIINQ